VYFHMTRDISDMLLSANVDLTLDELTAAQTKCLIGQPVLITEEFAILRISLGAPDVRKMFAEPENINICAERHILNKMSLIAKYSNLLTA